MTLYSPQILGDLRTVSECTAEASGLFVEYNVIFPHVIVHYLLQAPEENSSRASGSGESSGPSGSSQGEQKTDRPHASIFANLAQEVRDTMMPLKNIHSYTKVYKGPVAEGNSGVSEILVIKPVVTPWQKAWSTVQEKV